MRRFSKAAAHLPSDGKSAHVTHLRLAPVAPPQRDADAFGVNALGGGISTERRSSLSRATTAEQRVNFAAGDVASIFLLLPARALRGKISVAAPR